MPFLCLKSYPPLCGLYNDSQGLIWFPLTSFPQDPTDSWPSFYLLSFHFICYCCPFTHGYSCFASSLASHEITSLPQQDLWTSCFLCREWCYSLDQHGSNLFSLKPLFKCHLLKEITHFNVNWHHHSFLHLFPLVWSAYCFVALYWSPSNRLYNLFNIMFTRLPGFPLSPVRCELHEVTDLCLFFIISQYSFYCLHVLTKYSLHWIKVNVREAIQTKYCGVSEGKIPSVWKN